MTLHARSAQGGEQRPVLVTGGAGFIGANVCDRLAGQGTPVIVYDNLSRGAVERNLQWLRDRHGALIQHAHEDVRDRGALAAAVRGVGRVFHFAAQVAVTTSLQSPVDDFEVNARGTLNLLEAVRSQPEPPSVVYTSTNKVYGALPDVALEEHATRWEPADPDLRAHGVGEARQLDFHSPYGCSKGASDAYVLDYARSFGVPTVVLRMSCIYGKRQFGNEDQGWVAHFWRCALARQPLTIYGDGKQVRDILYVDDLVDALLLASDAGPALSGRAFNIGGGPANTVSLVELLGRIERSLGRVPLLRREDWRVGDQRYYVSDTRAFAAATGWRARISAAEGLERLHAWIERSEREASTAAMTPAVTAAGLGAGV